MSSSVLSVALLSKSSLTAFPRGELGSDVASDDGHHIGLGTLQLQQFCPLLRFWESFMFKRRTPKPSRLHQVLDNRGCFTLAQGPASQSPHQCGRAEAEHGPSTDPSHQEGHSVTRVNQDSKPTLITPEHRQKREHCPSHKTVNLFS